MGDGERHGWEAGDLPREDLERDVRDELAFHLETRVRDNVARGMTPEAARAEAQKRLGSREAVEREMLRIDSRRRRTRRRRDLSGDAARDFVLAVRTLRRRPVFAAVTVLTLALGIGASTAVFSVANQVLLRPVPGVRAPDSLVTIQVATERSPEAAFSLSHRAYLELREAAAPLAELAAGQVIDANVWLPGTDRPLRVATEYVTPGYSSVLGIDAVAGRTLGPGDRANPYVVVIGHGLWTTLFSGSSEALGSTLSLNGRDFTVVGVAPRGFRGDGLLGNSELWVPVEAHDAVMPQAGADPLEDGYPVWLTFVGRLSGGATADDVGARMDAAARRLEEEGARLLPAGALVRVRPGVGLSGWERAQLGGIFSVLGGVAALLVLLACANAANLLLARVEDRSDELAIRRAIGAGRARVARLLFAEAAILTGLAGALGLILATAAVRLFEGERFLTFMSPLEGIELDGRVLVFAAGLSVVTGLLFGAVPSLLATGKAATLRPGTRRASRSGPSHGLVVVQVAISVTLVIGAGLLLDTVVALGRTDLGFRPAGVREASVDPQAQGYDEARREVFFRRLLDGARSLPGAAAAGLASYPVQGRMRAGNLIRPEGGGEDDPLAVRASSNQVSPGFLQAAGLELTAGRDFRPDEMYPEAGAVVILSESAARHLFPSGAAVGRRVDLGFGETTTAEVVGVVRDARLTTVRDPGGALVLEPFGQPWAPGRATLYVRGRGEGGPAAADLPGLLRDIDPSLPFFDLQPLTRRVTTTLTVERILARLTSVFAGLALLLAAVGLYGLLAIVVRSRTREMGIRLALGARPGQVRALVVARGLSLSALGVVIGLGVASQAARLLESRLWGVRPLEPAVFAGAALVLLATSLVASLGPAVRATRVDPAEALAAD